MYFYFCLNLKCLNTSKPTGCMCHISHLTWKSQVDSHWSCIFHDQRLYHMRLDVCCLILLCVITSTLCRNQPGRVFTRLWLIGLTLFHLISSLNTTLDSGSLAVTLLVPSAGCAPMVKKDKSWPMRCDELWLIRCDSVSYVGFCVNQIISSQFLPMQT